MVSVVIPAYNAEKEIPSCLDSLLNQTFPKEQCEIIVVNDGSTDGTEKIVRKYDGVKIFTQPNQGPAAARNKGVSESKGEIIVFTDSDCIPEKNWLEEMLKPFNDAEVVGVQGAYKTRQKEVVARFAQIEIEERYWKMSRNERVDFIGSYSAAYRKKEFEEHGGFDTRFPIASGEDADLSYTMSNAGHKLVFNPNAIVYHQHPQTLKKYFRQKFGRAYWRNLLYKKNMGKMIKDSYTPQLLKIQMGLLSLVAFLLLIGALTTSRLVLGIGVCGIPLLGASYIPFMIQAIKKDLFIGLISPFLLTVRSFALLCGLGIGFIKEVWLKRESHES